MEEKSSLQACDRPVAGGKIKWEPYLETCGGNLFPLLGCRECLPTYNLHTLWDQEVTCMILVSLFQIGRAGSFQIGRAGRMHPALHIYCIRLFTFTVSSSSKLTISPTLPITQVPLPKIWVQSIDLTAPPQVKKTNEIAAGNGQMDEMVQKFISVS